MLPLPKGAVWQTFLLLSIFLLINEAKSEEGRVVCYYTNWSVYRPGTAKFNPQNINPYLCTHLIYAFGGFTKDNTLKPFDKYQDIEQGGYAKFTGLKTYNKNLKTMLAIGGWNEGSSRFSPLVASSERRQQFVKNILKFLRQNHFDGIDLDWEYPAYRDGGKPRDKDNYAQFVQELRSEFDREAQKTGRQRMLITMAVPAGIEYIDKGYDIPKLNKYLDWFNLLSYDYHSAFEPAVNHHSPLYSLEEQSEYNFDTELNIDYSIKFYLQAGADREKLVLGIPTYGRSYTLYNEESTDIGAPADGPGEQGDATREKGYLAYYEICQNLREDDWTVVQPNPKAMGPYAFKGNQWVGYDDEAIVRKKAEYVVDNGLGGIMFWSIDNDDFRGLCTGKPYPLIEAAKETMLDRLGLGDNEVSQPQRPKKPSRSRSRIGSASRNKIVSSEEKPVVSPKKENARRPTSKRRPQVTKTTTSTSTEEPYSSSAGSSLYIGGRTTTPAPPTTPDPGSDFKCEDEGFFQHPRDCKKYFWCLDSGPSNLGIVAHQFTCPSGLYFNPSADSCDFARNVPCKKSATTTSTAKPITTTKPTTTSTTTTNSPKITAATNRNTFFRYSTTTTSAPAVPAEDEYEYEEEESESNRDRDAEEDPRVIKELIELIRKVGGIEELEKHLLQQDDGSMLLKDSKNAPTTQSPISKSLYEKVLSRPSNLNSFRNRFTSNTLSRSTPKPTPIKNDNDDGGLEEEKRSSDGRYSSVIRNSRPNSQSAGIEKLPEFEGFLKEKPKYVTINRSRTTAATKSNEENDDASQNTNDSEKDDEEEQVTTKSRISTNAYKNIRRSRPTTTPVTIIDEDDDDEEEEIIPERNRSNGRQPAYAEKNDETTTTIAPPNRYKFIERSRPTRPSTTEVNISPDDNDNDEDDDDNNEDTNNVTVQFLEPNELTTLSPPTQKSNPTTIRNYANLGRRTTTTTTNQATTTTTNFITETTTTIPELLNSIITTTLTPISDNNSPTPVIFITTTPKTLDVSLSNDYDQSTHRPIIESSESGLDTQNETERPENEIDNDTITNNNKNNNNDDEVTLTNNSDGVHNIYSSNKNSILNSVNSISSNNYNKNNNFETSPSSNNNLDDNINNNNSKLSSNRYNGGDKRPTQFIRTTTTKTKFTSSDNDNDLILSNINNLKRKPILNTQSTTETSTNEFLGTVSSPRPFGYPRRRRPTTTSKPRTTNTNDNNASTETETDTATTKNRLQQQKPNSRRPVLSVRRRFTTSTEINASTSKAETLNSQTAQHSFGQQHVDSSTAVSAFKYNNRRTRPSYLTTKPTTDIKTATITTTNSNDITRPTQKYSSPSVNRRKYVRPSSSITTATSSHTRRLTTIPPLSIDEDEALTEVPKTPNPLFKRRFTFTTTQIPLTTTKRPIITTFTPDELEAYLPDDVDQVAKSSIQDSKFINNRFNQIGENLAEQEELVGAIKAISKAPIRLHASSTTQYLRETTFVDSHPTKPANHIDAEPILKRISTTVPTRKPSSKRKPQKTTPTPVVLTLPTVGPIRRRPSKPQTFQKLNSRKFAGRTYRPILDYDYYDDEDVRVVGKTNSQVKVVLHGAGIIECLDQGNFPHPLSCRKFISCAKIESGGVVGWEYTCPKGLSYDPVGGICNWSAGVGCKD